MRTKRLFSSIMAIIMIFSLCSVLPVKISVPLNTCAITEANQEFINNLGYSAQKNYSRYKILPSMTVAQAILESNWGKSSLSKLYYNFFGMKAGSNYTGETVTLKTGEEINGNKITVNGTFRVYHSFDEGIEGYYQFITGYSRYSNLIGETDYKTACNKIRQDGWATDSAYSTKLINLIETYNLTRFDSFSSAVQMVTPSISTDKNSYTVGDTVNISWTASPSGSNLEHYWLKIDDPNGNTIVNETMNRNTSYSFITSLSGNYTVTAFATPYNSPNGEGSLTDTKTISVKPKNVSYDLSLSENYIELEPNQSKDIKLTIKGDFSSGTNLGYLGLDTSGCDNIVDISNTNGGRTSSYIEMTYKVTALSSGSGSCRFYVTLDGKTIGSVNLNIVVKVKKCKVKLIDNFRSNTIDEYEIECGSTFSSSQLPTQYKVGYSFDGWYKGNQKYSVGSIVPDVSELRLYAQWKAYNDNDIYFDRYGDINGDGKISVVDVTRITNYINGTYELTDTEKIYADADGNGVISEHDAEIIKLMFLYAPSNETFEVQLARECWEEMYIYSYPLLSLKVNGQSSYEAKPGETVKLTMEVEGADLKYGCIGLYFSYDEELTLSRLKYGAAVENLSCQYNYNLTNCFITSCGKGNEGEDGIMLETEFTIPENAETGKIYPFEFLKNDYSLFTNYRNDKYGKKMQEFALNNCQNCSVKVIGGKGDINSDGKVTVADAVMLKRWLLGVSDTKFDNWKSADLSKDNKVDIFDMVEMRKLLIENK